MVQVLSYDITDDALPEPAHGGTPVETILSAQERQDVYQRAQDDPQSVIPRLRELVERFADVPVLHNWLVVAYTAAGDDEAADRAAELLYQRHPQYLFGRLHLAQRALAEGDLVRFEALFEKKFDLKLLYPWRDVFHISEYLSFASLLVEYYVRTQEDQAAEILLETMEQIAPDAPHTQRAREILEHLGILHTLKAVIERLAGGGRRRRRK
jgi:hypothetical protein